MKLRTREIKIKLENVETQSTSFDSTISKPIDTVDELLNWTAPQSTILKCKINLSENEMIPFGAKDRLIICHDMKGGYKNDRFINGFDGLKIPEFIWKLTSDFIYFSHHFITIPSKSLI